MTASEKFALLTEWNKKLVLTEIERLLKAQEETA